MTREKQTERFEFTMTPTEREDANLLAKLFDRSVGYIFRMALTELKQKTLYGKGKR